MYEVSISPRPGVMFYFDSIGPALARFSDAQLGALIRGIVEYAQTGALPELDGMEGLAFDMMRPKIDKDGDSYVKSCIHTAYMNACKKWKEQGIKPISESSFSEQVVVSYKGPSETCKSLPGATQDVTTATDTESTAEPTTATISVSNPAADTAASGNGKTEGCKGDERGNPASSDSSRLDAWKDFEQRRAAEVAKAKGKRG